MRPRLTRLVVALTLAAGLCAGATACGAGQEPTVTIVVPWADGGPEYGAFYNVVQPFAQSHHFQVKIISTPAFAQQLDVGEATDDLPDLVDLPSPGAVAQYENGFDGINLEPLSIGLRSYDQPWQSLAESAGTVYAVPIKADVKSLIWYKTGALPGSDWAALKSASVSGTPWCLGLANGSASGWPGADWVADILLSTYGPAAYESWLEGAWMSGQVANAWQTWGMLIRDSAVVPAVPGGRLGALKTQFNDAIVGTGCELEHGALSATGLPSTVGYSYEQFPSISGRPAPVLVSGDFMGLFTNNPYARSLLQYLATYTAQKSWVNQSGGYAFSADNAVQPDDYPPGVERKIANLLQPGTGLTMCFSAEDTMTPDLSAAFEQAILEYVNDPDVTFLDGLLKGLQQTANGELKGTQRAGEQQVEEKACDLP